MLNKAMERKLKARECLDVKKEGALRKPEELPKSWHHGDGGNVYELLRFVEGVDYCDGELELWIWSIGRETATGRIYASTDTRFYQADGFDCLFLR